MQAASLRYLRFQATKALSLVALFAVSGGVSGGCSLFAVSAPPVRCPGVFAPFSARRAHVSALLAVSAPVHCERAFSLGRLL